MPRVLNMVGLHKILNDMDNRKSLTVFLICLRFGLGPPEYVRLLNILGYIQYATTSSTFKTLGYLERFLF